MYMNNILDFLKDEKNILICDRYVFSNHIHQTPRIAKFNKENKNTILVRKKYK